MTERITSEASHRFSEILNNPKTMEALRRSDIDIKEGRVREATSAGEMLRDLRGKRKK